MDELKKDQLEVKILNNTKKMGEKAAQNVADKMKEIIAEKGTVNMVFAAAPSQNEFLEALTNKKGIDWSNVVAFHLDEYVGLDYDSPNKFSSYLNQHLFDKVDLKEVYYIDQKETEIEELVNRYTKLLKANPIDIACIGIGENGHIAFNDPHVADFTDPMNFKLVDLDQECREQQVNDGCFISVDKVPTHALTMTVPSIISANYIYCMVPSSSKSQAVKDAIQGEITADCPASVLRSHQRSILYLDSDAAELITSS